jgi:choline dehydrogenase
VEEFDYVVVGGGTAGSVVAARLSEDPDATVVLLEAGPQDGPAEAADPMAWSGLLGSSVDWAYTTVPQAGTDGIAHMLSLGRVLGGSSTINGTIHLRGHRSSYDSWEAGAPGWNYESLLPYFMRSEQVEGGDPRFRGTDGPMRIEQPVEHGPYFQSVYQAALEAGLPEAVGGNRAEAEGVMWTETNVVGGRRQTAADAYLRPVLGRPNLTVIANGNVQRLLLTGSRCRGVEYVGEGTLHRVKARREVIVTAGAINSPVLLLRSGIGPAEYLRQVGVPVAAHLPGVGENLHDHPSSRVTYRAARPLDVGRSVTTALTFPHVIFRSAPTSEPDLMITPAPVVFGRRWRVDLENPGFTLLFALMRPASRGSVRLASSRAEDAPIIDPAYLTDDRDIERFLVGLRMARQVGEASAMKPWCAGELDPGPDAHDDDALITYLRSNTDTYFHPVGTCRMGADDMAVVDPMLRVHGIEGLRVADASIMPSIPSANTNATVLAIAERAADLIKSSQD